MKKPKNKNRREVSFKNLVIEAGSVRVESGGSGYDTHIFMDGVKQMNITELSFKVAAGERAKLRVVMFVPKATIKPA